MRRVLGGVAAALALAAISGFYVIRAAADSATDRGSVLFFSGIDLWRNGAFLYGGGLWSPEGNDSEGFTLKASGGGGAYRYHSGTLNADVIGRTFSNALLPGWRFKRDGFIVTVFAGAELQYHHLSPYDPDAKLRGLHAGVKTGFEIWYQPAALWMVAADAFVITIGPSYSANARIGWRAFDLIYVGPEMSGFAYDDNYRQFRIGLHATALTTGAFEWSGGAGWARDSDHRQGAYGRIGMNARY